MRRFWPWDLSGADHGALLCEGGMILGKRRVVFFIDGWFMRKRVYSLKLFHYDGNNIRRYCLKHLKEGDYLYRIFYYDTKPLEMKGHNPITKKAVDFSKTEVAREQKSLFDSIRSTPNMALRLGETVWHGRAWTLRWEKLKRIINGEMQIHELQESDIQPTIVQKGVDMRIGLDVALIAIKNLADLMVIITGDADVVPALKLARKEGMQVLLDPLGRKVSSSLAEHVDFLSTKIDEYINEKSRP